MVVAIELVEYCSFDRELVRILVMLADCDQEKIRTACYRVIQRIVRDDAVFAPLPHLIID